MNTAVAMDQAPSDCHYSGEPFWVFEMSPCEETAN